MATPKKMDSYLHIGFKEWYKTEALKWTDEAPKWPFYHPKNYGSPGFWILICTSVIGQISHVIKNVGKTFSV